MTDKIITTFETNITWFYPSDQLPEKDSICLISTWHLLPIREENGEVKKVRQLYIIITVQFDGTLFHDPFCKRDIGWTPDHILRWAKLPDFE